MTRRFLLAATLTIAACSSLPHMPSHTQVGLSGDSYRLPNGWTITPVGKQVTLPDLPLNIIPLGGGRALVACSGYNAHDLTIVNLKTGETAASATVTQSWYGLAVDAAQKHVWWSGGGSNVIHTFDYSGGKLTRTGPPEPPSAGKTAKTHTFRSGIAVDEAAGFLYSLDVDAGTITRGPLDGSEAKTTAKLGGRPYDVAMAHDGKHLIVTDWAGSRALLLDRETLKITATASVGQHPTQIAIHPKDGRIFIACANSNSVSVIDPAKFTVAETIYTSLFPRAPEGSTPDALCVSPDGRKLYVANADNNCIAVLDIAAAGRTQVQGFIPTGWYPTSVAVTPDNKKLLVGVGKGNQTHPNTVETRAEQPGDLVKFKHIGTTLSGALSIIDLPFDSDGDDDDDVLKEWTAIVYRNCPYSDTQLTSSGYSADTVIPRNVGDPCPIKHVIYIIKENRTYDQVFGDMKEGNGDPTLCMFPEAVTPNHHKLARDFVLLDNLYCNGHVSADGHPWSTQAYNTDYIARNWALTYSKRTGIDDDDEGHLTRGNSGHIWDAAKRKGLRYRNYGEGGERVSQPDKTYKVESRDPTLVGHISSDYGTFGSIRDTKKAEVFLREFAQFEKDGTMPHLMVLSLPEDHTFGTKPNTHSPKACVASNDAALGMIVEGVSHSSYWDKTAIFVIEDDAQNGADHVDAHRTVGLVISPYTRRGVVDSTQYSTVSMLRTMELMLGLPPLSQYDAAAHPMLNSFTSKPDLRPYTPAATSTYIDELNLATAYGSDRSAKMDFSDFDRIDDFELNEILWRAVMGVDAPLPPAVRRAIAYKLQP